MCGVIGKRFVLCFGFVLIGVEWDGDIVKFFDVV